jgi:uncharacterized membrane protein
MGVTSERLKAFSDGVLAIIVTIMVLELKAPHGEDFPALLPLWPVFLAYVLSFIYVAIYWNNHHHLFAVVEKVNGAVLWANIHLLFWLSLLPFVTAWASESHFARDPVALYGLVLLGGKDFKGKISIVAYLAGMVGTCLSPWIGCLVYVGVAAMWLIPDRRIESRLGEV